MSLEWYEKHHKKNENDAFNQWWKSFYGLPKDYTDDPDEYWIRKGFALSGWIGQAHYFNTEILHGPEAKVAADAARRAMEKDCGCIGGPIEHQLDCSQDT